MCLQQSGARCRSRLTNSVFNGIMQPFVVVSRAGDSSGNGLGDSPVTVLRSPSFAQGASREQSSPFRNAGKGVRWRTLTPSEGAGAREVCQLRGAKSASRDTPRRGEKMCGGARGEEGGGLKCEWERR